METIEVARTSGYFNVFENPVMTTLIGAGGVLGIAGSIIDNILYANYISSQEKILKDINNSNLTQTQKDTLVSELNQISVSSTTSFNSNISNLCILQGFINSNITTQQFVPNLKTNEITLNNKSIDKFSLDNLDDFAKTANGIYYDITNGKLAIGTTPDATNYFKVGGQTTINGSLYATTIYENGTQLIDKYLTSSTILNVSKLNKKTGFLCSVNNPIYPNGGNELFYKYDIYLPSYTITQNLPFTNDPYRIFEINVFIATCYFNTITNDLPDIINYKIYMSNKANAGSPFGDAGINLCATGFPINYKLDKIMANNIFLMRNNTNNFNYISIITRQIADVRVVISDLLN